MKRKLDDLSESLSAVGSAGVELAKAEAAALSDELKLSGKALLRVLLLVALCLFLVFWSIGVLALAGIEIGALWLPRWGAALAVLGLVLLLALAVALLARQRLRRLEGPGTTARRRLEDHAEWWQKRILRRDE